jgi:putative ABC transport system ATP-binding protein
VIHCEDIEFGYPQSDFRLSVPRFEVADGEKAALVGPSGSGKTTLLDLIAGVRAPDRGTVTVGDVAVSKLTDSRRRRFRLTNIGFVFQDFELFDHLSVRENILFPLTVGGFPKETSPQRRAELEQLADALGMRALLDRRTDRLSRGEQQRAALCRALVHRPAIVLADEPTGNLDPANKQLVMRLLISAAAERNVTLLATTHDESLLSLFDRVIDVRSLGMPT